MNAKADQPKAPESKPGPKPDAKDDATPAAKDDLKTLPLPEVEKQLGSSPHRRSAAALRESPARRRQGP